MNIAMIKIDYSAVSDDSSVLSLNNL